MCSVVGLLCASIFICISDLHYIRTTNIVWILVFLSNHMEIAIAILV